MASLSLRHIYKKYPGGVTAVSDFNLEIKDKEFIVFVEVKARNENSIALPREFVDEQKQAKIIATAGLYIQKYNVELQPRFDVIEIYMQNNKVKSIKHLENAFCL